jgi:hypothetical protein
LRRKIRCGPAVGGWFQSDEQDMDMNTSHRLAVLPIALALSAGAFANDDTTAGAVTNSEAVSTLKSSLPSTSGFEVEKMRTTDSGISCIVYRVRNDQGNETRAQAVVQGEKVLRSSSRSKDFEKAWNSNCVTAK